MDYRIDYTREASTDALDRSGPAPIVRYVPAPRRFELPAIVKTTLTMAATGAILIGAEAFAPEPLKLSHWVGSAEARIAAAEKAGELRVQALYEPWVEQVKLNNAQNLENYRAGVQLVGKSFDAAVEKSRIAQQTQAGVQANLANQKMAEAYAASATDIAIAGASRAIGRLGNALQPGSGDGLMQYSDEVNRDVQASITAAADTPAVRIEGQDTATPAPEMFWQQLAAMKPLPLPPPPRLEEASAILAHGK